MPTSTVRGALVALFAVCVLAAVPAAQASHQFTDVPTNHPFHTEIGIFKDTNITSGCTATTFCPDDFVKRQAMAAFIDRALGLVVRPGESTLQGIPGSRIAMLDDGSSLVRTNADGLELSHAGLRGLRIEGANGFIANIIGGYQGNFVTEGAAGATVAGGGYSENLNRVTDSWGTVGGGLDNQAGNAEGDTTDRQYATVGGGGSNGALGIASTVAGGIGNTAAGLYGAVGGGLSNSAGGARATVAGGAGNVATGLYGTIAGGESNTASGDYSFAAGARAQATNTGAFVWADTSPFNFSSNANNSFGVRAIGGARFVSAVNGTTGAATAGVELAAGGGSWASLSDRAAKRNFRPLDRQALLRRLAAVPIGSWSYRSQPDRIRHLGPTAQDFRRAFGVGEDSRHITSVDADGVALAAIQALYRQNQALRRANLALARRNAVQDARLTSVERQLARLAQRR